VEWKKMKITEGFSNSKNIVFNIQKPLNVGVYLPQRQRGKKKLYGRNEQQILQN
jgi:hypothetical protein